MNVQSVHSTGLMIKIVLHITFQLNFTARPFSNKHSKSRFSKVTSYASISDKRFATAVVVQVSLERLAQAQFPMVHKTEIFMNKKFPAVTLRNEIISSDYLLIKFSLFSP